MITFFSSIHRLYKTKQFDKISLSPPICLLSLSLFLSLIGGKNGVERNLNREIKLSPLSLVKTHKTNEPRAEISPR